MPTFHFASRVRDRDALGTVITVNGPTSTRTAVDIQELHWIKHEIKPLVLDYDRQAECSQSHRADQNRKEGSFGL